MGNITLRSNINNDEYTTYLYESFDIQNREETITEIPMIDMHELDSIDWNIGVILGNSGAGKSTILRQLNPTFEHVTHDFGDKCVISCFENLTPEQATNVCFGIGLSSVPSLLRRPHQLSNGERARFDIAYEIGHAKPGETIYIDEYTSVVNRETAKSMSFALQRLVRQKNLKIILASCHYDIIEWLQPDWVYNLNRKAEIEHITYADKYVSHGQISDADALTAQMPLPNA